MKFKRESIKKKNKKTHADQARRSWSREWDNKIEGKSGNIRQLNSETTWI
jgi:hypothetical protein